MNPSAIFKFETPVGERYADPIEVIRKLQAHTGNRIDSLVADAYFLTCIDPENKYKRVDGEVVIDSYGNPEINEDWIEFDKEPGSDHPAKLMRGSQAQEELVKAIRYAFSLAPFDPNTGKGATELYCCKLFNSFGRFVEELKKNTGSKQT